MTVPNFGSCPCGGHFENRWVQVRMTAGGKVLLKDVPQGTCSLCGSRVYLLETLARIESVFKGRQ
jgi:hypothetical protein